MTYKEMIETLSIEEKMRCLIGGGMNTSYVPEGASAKPMRYHDGPFGLRMKTDDSKDTPEETEKIRSQFPNAGQGDEVLSTAFPTGCALGCTWDTELVEKVGNALGEEYRAKEVNAILGPSMNIKRHPLCGRNFEYFSEDPYLTGKLAGAYVRGVQEKGVAACPKHFALNHQEEGRAYVSSEVDGRTFREFYLKPFEMVVKEEHPWSIMCAYNRINGVYASEHQQLLSKILREEWGFDGMIISDWSAVKNRAYALKASVEMSMPYQEEAFGQLMDAYEKGEISEEMIDDALSRIALFYERTKGVYDRPSCDFAAHHELAVEAARKSIVMLKNEEQILPLKKEETKKVLVIGGGAVHPYIGGDGSSRVMNPTQVDLPLEEIKRLLGEEAEVKFVGADKLDAYKSDIGHLEGELLPKAAWADVILVFLNQELSCSSEAMDRHDIFLNPTQEYVMKLCNRVNDKIVAILNVGDVIAVHRWEPYVQGIFVSWLGGQGMGRAVAETLFGYNNPSGRLAETFPRSIQDVESLKNYPGDGYKVVYKEQMMVGYRDFDTSHIQPEYEFGFGLSYSSFVYKDLHLSEKDLTFIIENTSGWDGEETAQVYIEFPKESWNSHPAQELRAFKKVRIPAHQEQKVVIPLTEDMFTYYNTALEKWAKEDGVYRIKVGSSSRNLPLVCEKRVTSGEKITTEWKEF